MQRIYPISLRDLSKYSNIGKDQWISYSNTVFNRYYSYYRVNYIDMITTVKVSCPKHDEFKVTPENHLLGYGCPNCRRYTAMSNEIFIKTAERIWPNYEYSCTQYFNNEVPIKVKCNTHNIFFRQLPDRHLNKIIGCPDCLFQLKFKEKIGRMLDQILHLGIKNHERLTDDPPKTPVVKFDKSEIIRFNRQAEKEITVGWRNKVYDHTKYIDKIRVNGYVVQNSIENAREIAKVRSGKCLSHVFTSNKIPLIWQCSLGHIWNTASYSNVKNHGSWCPTCSACTSEYLTKMLLESITQIKFEQCRPDFLIREDTGRKLELDGYNEENSIAFEYQGIQHYSADVLHRNTEDTFEQQQIKDKLKVVRCEENGITLIVVPYWERDKGPENLARFLYNELQRQNRAELIKIPVSEIPIVEIEKQSFDKKKKNRELFDKIKTIVENKGYTMITDYYRGAGKITYTVQCPEGHEIEKSHTSLIKPGVIKCYICCPVKIGVRTQDNQPITTELVKKYIIARGWRYDSFEYVHSHVPINLTCSVGHNFSMSWHNMQKVSCCKVCIRNPNFATTMIHTHAIRCSLRLIRQKYINFDKQQWQITCRLCDQTSFATAKDICKCTRGIYCEDCFNRSKRQNKFIVFTDFDLTQAIEQL